MEGGAVGHNFERDTPRDHLCQVWTLHRCFLPSLAPFGQAVSEEKIFLTLANQKQELPLTAIFVGGMEKLYRRPYIDAFCQVWFHLAQLFQRSRLKYEKVNGRMPSDGNTSHDPLGQVS